MRYIIFVLATVAIFLACNTGSINVKGSFKPDKLETAQYVINIDRDTTIETKNGALLKIPKGALSTDNGNTVTLEIKEAYSLQQMIQAGLTTQSNGDPLSSGGMIYIGAASGQTVTINQKIQVAVPADFLDKNMQLYKGEEENGTLNWNDPAPLPVNNQLTAIDTGRILFESKCANCHAIGKDMTGPDLAHFMKRFADKGGDADYMLSDNHYYEPKHTEINNNADTVRIDSVQRSDTSFFIPDIYGCNLVRMYGSRPPHIEGTYDEFRKIYRYIQNESDRRNLPLPKHAYLFDCVDSCYQYIRTARELFIKQQELKDKRNQQIKENGEMTNVIADPTWQQRNDLPLPPDFDKKVSPENYSATYYQFSVESFGWYNIDMLVKNVNGVEESELFVRIVGQYRERINVFLIIPSVKVYGEGGPADRNSEEFAFFYKDGKIPLPQNAQAYILAVTENEESIAFGLKQFTTSTKQELEVELRASSKEEFAAAMKQFDMKDFSVTVADSKNADELRKADSTLKSIEAKLTEAKKLLPKGCDCQCGPESAYPIISKD